MPERASTFWRGLLLLVPACATVDARDDFAAADGAILASTGVERAVGLDVEAALADGLAFEESLRLALALNPRLAAGYARLGIARADLVQAGLWANPELSFGFLFPAGGGRTHLALDLLANVSELWRLPARRRTAEAELEGELLALSRQAGELVHETAAAYHAAVLAEGEHALAEEELGWARDERSAVRARREQGVARELDELRVAQEVLALELTREQAVQASVRARARLAALLGLERDLAGVTLVDALPASSRDVPASDLLVARALATRLDLRAAGAALAAAEATLAGGAVPTVEAGLSVERPEGDGATLRGLAGTVELPVFDTGGARLARARFRLEEVRALAQALRVEATQEVRAAAAHAEQAERTRRRAEEELVPGAVERERRLAAGLARGDVTRTELLAARRELVAARRVALTAQHAAAEAGLALTLAVGAPFVP